MRLEAAKVLGSSQDLTALPALLAMLNDKNAYIRSTAAEALGHLGMSKTFSSTNKLWEVGDDKWCLAHKSKIWNSGGSTLDLGEPAISALKQALKDNDTIVRNKTAKALELIGATGGK